MIRNIKLQTTSKAKSVSQPVTLTRVYESDDSSDDLILVSVEKPKQKSSNKTVEEEPVSADLDTPLSEILKNEIKQSTCLISEPFESLEDPRLCRSPIRTPDVHSDSPAFLTPKQTTENRVALTPAPKCLQFDQQANTATSTTEHQAENDITSSSCGHSLSRLKPPHIDHWSISTKIAFIR